MTNPNPNVADIFRSWKEMYDQFEATWAKPVQEMLESESFTQSLAQSRTQYVNSQKVNRDAIEQQLEALRIPTKTDLARLATQILSVENRAEAIEDAVEDLTARLVRIEAKLDQLLSPAAKPAAPAPVAPKAPKAAVAEPAIAKVVAEPAAKPAKTTAKKATKPAAAKAPAKKAPPKRS